MSYEESWLDKKKLRLLNCRVFFLQIIGQQETDDIFYEIFRKIRNGMKDINTSDIINQANSSTKSLLHFENLVCDLLLPSSVPLKNST
jgi:hypothetical protein